MTDDLDERGVPVFLEATHNEVGANFVAELTPGLVGDFSDAAGSENVHQKHFEKSMSRFGIRRTTT